MAERTSTPAIPAIVGGVIAALLGLAAGAVLFAPIVGVLLGVVLAAAVGVALFLVFPAVASRFVRQAIGGAPPDPSRADHARLVNLVDGLTATMGVPVPEVVVVDDPAVNALVAGRDPRQAVLAVTSGLLQHGSRLELEAVLARELCLVRDRSTGPRDTQAVAGLFGPSDHSDPADADLAAIAVTRYPPGLINALRLAAGGEAPSGHRVLSQLWFVPNGADVASRVQVLEELL